MTSVQNSIDNLGNKLAGTKVARAMTDLTARRFMFLFSIMFIIILIIAVLVVGIFGMLGGIEKATKYIPFMSAFSKSQSQPIVVATPPTVQQPAAAPIIVTESETLPLASAKSEKYTSRYPAGVVPGSILAGDISPTVNTGTQEYENPHYTRMNALWQKSDDTANYFDNSIAAWNARPSPFAQ